MLELNKKTIKLLQELIKLYDEKNKKADFDCALEIVDILNKDELFNNFIICQRDYTIDGFEVSTDYSDCEVIYINPMNIKKEIQCDINPLSYYYDSSYQSQIYNLYFLAVMLHEAVHIEQNLCGYYNISSYKEVNHLYKKYRILDKKLSIYRKMLYKYFGYEYAFERHANIEAFKEIVKIYEDSPLRKIGEMNYCFSIIDGYKNKKNNFISPVEVTLKRMGSKEKIICNDLPFDVALIHGFSIDEDLYNNILNSVIKQNLFDVSFLEVEQKIKTLSK